MQFMSLIVRNNNYDGRQAELARRLRIKPVTMKRFLPDFLQSRLARDLTLALALKLVLIAIVYYAFFSGTAVQPDANAVAQRLASPAAQSSD
jgi:hypothetical protein